MLQSFHSIILANQCKITHENVQRLT